MKLLNFFQTISKEKLSLEDKARIFSEFQEKRTLEAAMWAWFWKYILKEKTTTLDAERKRRLFAQIASKKEVKGSFIKARNLMKIWSFVWLFLVVSWVLFLWNYQWEPWVWESNDWYIWFNVDDSVPVIYAEEIGRIIETSGWVSITSGWKEKNADHLTVSDTVKLLSGAELVFNVQDDVQAKIIWPAEFSLEKNGDTYVINMLSGEYVELKSINIKSDVENEVSLTSSTTGDENKDKINDVSIQNPILEKWRLPEEPTIKKKVKVVVKTPDFEVVSDSTDWAVDMVIREENWKQMVENTWVNVMITKVIKDERVITELKSQQIASINWEVKVLETVVEEKAVVDVLVKDIDGEEAQILAEKIKNNDLKISYKIWEDSSTLDFSETVDEDNSVSPKNNSKSIVEADLMEKNVSDDIDSPSLDNRAETDLKQENKRVISWDDLTSLILATNTSLIMWHIRWIVQNRAHWEYSAAQRSLLWLSWLFSPLSQNLLGWMNLDTRSAWSLAVSLQTALANIEAKRYIPPWYTNKLKSVIAWLRLIDTIAVWTVERSCSFECIIVDVLHISPSQRSFLLLPAKSSYISSSVSDKRIENTTHLSENLPNTNSLSLQEENVVSWTGNLKIDLWKNEKDIPNDIPPYSGENLWSTISDTSTKNTDELYQKTSNIKKSMNAIGENDADDQLIDGDTNVVFWSWEIAQK